MRKDAAIIRTRLCMIAGAPELAHAGVDDRIAGLARASRRETRPRRRGRESARTRASAARVGEIGMGVEQRVGKIAPAEFRRDISPQRRRGAGRRRPPPRPSAAARRGDRSRRTADAAERREVAVGAGGRARPGSRRARRRRSGASAVRAPSSPGFRRARARPTSRALSGVSRERVDRRARAARRRARARPRGAAGAGRGAGRGPRPRWRRQKAENVPDGRAVGLRDLPRLAHQPAVEARGLDAALLQRRLDAARRARSRRAS